MFDVFSQSTAPIYFSSLCTLSVEHFLRTGMVGVKGLSMEMIFYTIVFHSFEAGKRFKPLKAFKAVSFPLKKKTVNE